MNRAISGRRLISLKKCSLAVSRSCVVSKRSTVQGRGHPLATPSIGTTASLRRTPHFFVVQPVFPVFEIPRPGARPCGGPSLDGPARVVRAAASGCFVGYPRGFRADPSACSQPVASESWCARAHGAGVPRGLTRGACAPTSGAPAPNLCPQMGRMVAHCGGRQCTQPQAVYL